jgi:hypothetical protein
MLRFVALLLLFAPSMLDELVSIAAASGRVVGIAETPSDRLAPSALLSPGAPPVLSFRYFDASDRGRFADIGLMTDDAGH